MLPIAATWGWYVGRRELFDETNPRTIQLHRDYFKGLNYLIDEQPDKAVDVFVKLIEVDSDTVEMHLALGNLFRRRGEVDRAIRIHQNLIARPELDQVYKLQALAALGQDYLRAGMLDRAERLFQELLTGGGASELSLRFLLHIYQQEKDWCKAIQTAEQLTKFSTEAIYPVIAQYHCEIALQEIARGELQRAERELTRAQKCHANCVRASLIRAQIAMQAKDYQNAIICYKQVVEQDSDYISEIVNPLCHCYQQLQEEEKLIEYLQTLLTRFPRIRLVIALSQYFELSDNKNKKAIEFVTTHIKREPSLRGLSHLAGLYLANSTGDTRDKLHMLQNFMQQLLADKPIYRCLRCGFSTKTLFWLCPSCHSWSSIKPIQGLEGN